MNVNVFLELWVLIYVESCEWSARVWFLNSLIKSVGYREHTYYTMGTNVHEDERGVACHNVHAF